MMRGVASAGVVRVGVVLVLMAVAITAVAQQPGPGVRTLHEYFKHSAVPAKRGGRGMARATSRTVTRAPKGPPSLTLDVKKDELVLGANGPVNDAAIRKNPQGPLDPTRASSALDQETSKVDELNYFSSFDPSVIPYKRGVSQNRVVVSGDTYRLVTAPGRMATVPVQSGSKRRKTEDPFWGTFVLRMDGSGRYPIPSVSPDQRVLRLQSEPKMSAQVERDEAGNFYLKTKHRGLARVNMLVVVPRRYFDGALSTGVTWAQLDAASAAHPTLPAKAKRAARTVLNTIGTGRNEIPYNALQKLVRHFRDFQSAEFPAHLKRGDRYVSIATNKLGVCRHRSFAFVITARALGIPTRYVYNEAHAFVEVFWPGQGWRRIDLGGAADELMMRASAREERVHDGAARDPFPQPPAYVRELNRMAQMEQAARRDLAAKPGGNNAGGANGGASGTNGGTNGEDGPQSSDPNSASNASTTNASAAPDGANISYDAVTDPLVKPTAEDDRRVAPSLRMRATQRRVLRGKKVRVRGTLQADGRGRSGRTVKLYLGPANQAKLSASSARLVGQGKTDAQGRFQAEITIPADLPIGRWSLRAVFAGDRTLRPTESR